MEGASWQRRKGRVEKGRRSNPEGLEASRSNSRRDPKAEGSSRRKRSTGARCHPTKRWWGRSDSTLKIQVGRNGTGLDLGSLKVYGKNDEGWDHWGSDLVISLQFSIELLLLTMALC